MIDVILGWVVNYWVIVVVFVECCLICSESVLMFCCSRKVLKGVMVGLRWFVIVLWVKMI